MPREFRAAWIATVGNLDWPSRPGLTTAEQQRELVAMLDRLVALRMNAAILQVRPAADALYQSALEPWSDVLTGRMGRAPEPFYDPLAFAIAEAHARGLELHAWINPYRAKHPSTTTPSPGHVSRAHPELVRRYGSFLWMDPGDPRVRAHTLRVVLDIVRRYDVDAIHMDDYFYPYPEVVRGREIPFPDDVSYRRYRRQGGRLARGDWRRQNVDELVHALSDGIHHVKPWVRFGVSPFGIWRPGHPPPIRGLDQYAVLYADARTWWRAGWVDYLTPQLYWAIDRPAQSYPLLLAWWAEQNVHRRNLWPGNYTSKVGIAGPSGWRTAEILAQIRLTRAQPGATGNVHFSMSVFMQNPDSLDERLVRDVYTSVALVPPSPWRQTSVVPAPHAILRATPAAGWTVVLHPSATPSDRPRPWLWLVQTRTVNGWSTAILPGAAHDHAVSGAGAPAPLEVRVTALDRVGGASPVRRLRP